MKKIFSTLLLLFSIISLAHSQSEYQPYSYEFYQKLDDILYSTSTREHTAIMPYFIDDSLLKRGYDSLMNYGSDGKPHTWGHQKLFNEHLIDIKSPGSTFYADILPNFDIGQDHAAHKNTNLTSIGLQLGGTFGKKWAYYISGYDEQSVFPEYLNTYINQVGIVPGLAYDRNLGQNAAQWSYLTAVISFTPVKYLNISAGRDKTFIGDGYRSMVLSDYASPYLFFKLTGTLGNVKYMAMWTYMNDPAMTSQYGISRNKFGVFHYLDWNVSKRLSFGFFDNIMGFFTDDNGQKRPFDLNYINPLIFLQTVNANSDDPDKSLIGITGKYKIANGITAYGQFALNEFRSQDIFSGDGSFANKYGWQLGFRGGDLFGIKRLNYIVETNNAKPYTYSARQAIENYSENSEPLAHPWGANFRELVTILNYSYKRFNFSGEADFGRYGFNVDTLDYGKDIFNVYTDAARLYGNYTTQGLTTNMVYLQGKIGFLINPKYNLRVELGVIYRTEVNTVFDDRTKWITIGLKSSFRDIYTDLASYKVH